MRMDNVINEFLDAVSKFTPAENAAWGAVFGALIGDAAGARLEFMGRKPTASEVSDALQLKGGGTFGVAPGQVTDDGELTVALLHAIDKGSGKYIPDFAAEAYVDWAYSNPFDMGNATSSALRTGGLADASVISRRAREHNKDSQANGGLMRATPLVVATANLSAEETSEICYADTRMTHPHIVCQHATAAYVLAIRQLMRSPSDRLGAFTAAETFLSGLLSEPYEWLMEAKDSQAPIAAWPNAGHVKIAFMHAFYHLHKENSFASSLTETLLEGGDTDTNACIVGGLIGAARGVTGLLAKPRTEKMVKTLLYADTSLGQVRPERFHPASVISITRSIRF
jgi:ADP-ribosyl-[dinitrogen reductase] hydrolase